MAMGGGSAERVPGGEEHSRTGVWSRHLDIWSEGVGVWGPAEVVAAAFALPPSDKVRTCHAAFLHSRSPGT
jgi:hypothetical protein